MNIKLKDGQVMEVKDNARGIDVAYQISDSLGRAACGVKIDDHECDLRTVISEGQTVEILTFNDAYGKHAFLHSAAHLMAQAIKRLYPEVKFAIGPAIENGFYYDIDRKEPFSPDDLTAIEKEMKKIVKENLQIERSVLPREKALSFFGDQDEIYKVELITDLPENAEISLYSQGEFSDLCRGPHLMKTGQIKAFKLMSIAGAYWRGSEKNKMLNRIYGIAFPDKKDLKLYLERLEEAKKRDHRKIGKEMELFSMMDEGPGFPFFLPNGMILKNTLIDYWRELHKKAGYKEISTPIILNQKLWETSGHWSHYRENMYITNIDDELYAIKPMNCPGSLLVYKNKPHSYRDLPIRYAELGLVHRHEKSGTLHGLMRVRCFTQDDAHIFMNLDQVTTEIKNVVSLIDQAYRALGFNYHVELSTKPEDCIGSDEDWDLAINSLKLALDELNLPYVINEGDGAFYGPKIDFHLEDTIGRTWQCATVQLDFQLPDRFEADYVGSDGEKHRPIMIHRVLFGSIERFIGILIEHFAGKFPTWLAPIQVKILPVSDKFVAYAKTVESRLNDANIRVELDDRDEKLGYKIRQAQTERVPYMIICGAKEQEENNITIRIRGKEHQPTCLVDEFINKISEEIKDRSLQQSDL